MTYFTFFKHRSSLIEDTFYRGRSRDFSKRAVLPLRLVSKGDSTIKFGFPRRDTLRMHYFTICLQKISNEKEFGPVDLLIFMTQKKLSFLYIYT
jgi:hypothetical protein